MLGCGLGPMQDELALIEASNQPPPPVQGNGDDVGVWTGVLQWIGWGCGKELAEGTSCSAEPLELEFRQELRHDPLIGIEGDDIPILSALGIEGGDAQIAALAKAGGRTSCGEEGLAAPARTR